MKIDVVDRDALPVSLGEVLDVYHAASRRARARPAVARTRTRTLAQAFQPGWATGSAPGTSVEPRFESRAAAPQRMRLLAMLSSPDATAACALAPHGSAVRQGGMAEIDPLISRAQRGEPQALAELFRRYRGDVDAHRVPGDRPLGRSRRRGAGGVCPALPVVWRRTKATRSSRPGSTAS